MPFFLRGRERKCSAGFQPANVLLTQKELSSLHAGETPALRFSLTSCASAVRFGVQALACSGTVQPEG